jgi:hypothetical protein
MMARLYSLFGESEAVAIVVGCCSQSTEVSRLEVV